MLTFIVANAFAASSFAQAEVPTVNLGGYFRVMARPDLQGGDGALGYSNLYGRLLNERPYAALELRLNLLKPQPARSTPWTALHFKIEGDSLANASPQRLGFPAGSLAQMRLSQAFVLVGDFAHGAGFLDDVVLQLGTLESTFGDLGLYDMRPAQLLLESIGVQGRYRGQKLDIVVGAGDAGLNLRGVAYNPVPTVAATVRVHPIDQFEIGVGGQLLHETPAPGNPNAPLQTPSMRYEDWVRGEVLQRYLEENPNRLQLFPNPQARASTSFKAIGYLGVGNLGPLRWDSAFASLVRRHPQQKTQETFQNNTRDLYVADFTDDRYELTVGNEMQLRVVPDFMDVAFAQLWLERWDTDDTLTASERNGRVLSSVLRLQTYLTQTLHILLESSLAYERSLQGNLYRQHVDSVFRSSASQADVRGLEFGDLDERWTWQGKGGLVVNPFGPGVYLRPSLRFLYGLQYSTQNRAYGNVFVDSLDQYNTFGGDEVHLHHVVSVEAEAWF